MIPLKRFLDISYALLVDEYQRVGVDLITALEKTQQWVGGGTGEKAESTVTPNQPDAAAGIAMLKARMADVKGSPI